MQCVRVCLHIARYMLGKPRLFMQLVCCVLRLRHETADDNYRLGTLE